MKRYKINYLTFQFQLSWIQSLTSHSSGHWLSELGQSVIPTDSVTSDWWVTQSLIDSCQQSMSVRSPWMGDSLCFCSLSMSVAQSVTHSLFIYWLTLDWAIRFSFTLISGSSHANLWPPKSLLNFVTFETTTTKQIQQKEEYHWFENETVQLQSTLS